MIICTCDRPLHVVSGVKETSLWVHDNGTPQCPEPVSVPFTPNPTDAAPTGSGISLVSSNPGAKQAEPLSEEEIEAWAFGVESLANNLADRRTLATIRELKADINDRDELVLEQEIENEKLQVERDEKGRFACEIFDVLKATKAERDRLRKALDILKGGKDWASKLMDTQLSGYANENAQLREALGICEHHPCYLEAALTEKEKQ